MAEAHALLQFVRQDDEDDQRDLRAWEQDFDLGQLVTATNRIADVETVWRRLEAGGVESPGQSFEFVRLWTEKFGIAPENQLYVTAYDDGLPVALLPLWRRRKFGVGMYSWFPGAHVGCNAPLIDRDAIAAMSPERRRTLWQEMAATLSGGDILYLKAIPRLVGGQDGLFDQLGTWLPAETLYRAEFASWDDANARQRSKSRRKHDRQQGERLDALGQVGFEEIGPGAEALKIVDIMFRQRAARFVQMKVDDPFADPKVRAFYDATVRPDSPVAVRLHVLRLDGAVVAVRYNIALGDRLYCLISSMSDDPAIQAGSPGKQCLLRVMQTVFDQGYAGFDMGAGFTDEKRHWCNVQTELRNHYVPLTLRGRAAGRAHRQWQVWRSQIKANDTLKTLAKSLRAAIRLPGAAGKSAPPPTDD